MSVGGLSEKKAADAEIQEICEKIKAAAEGQAGKSFSRFQAKYYRSQLVAEQKLGCLWGKLADHNESLYEDPASMALDSVSSNVVSNMSPADAEIQSICDELKSYAEQQSGKTFGKFEAKCYDLQGEMHRGINFYIKVHVGDGSYVHIWVYRCAPQEAQKYHQLTGIQLNKTETDPLLPWKPSLVPPKDADLWTNLSQKKDADSEVQALCNEIRCDAERETKKTFVQFEAKFYYTNGDYNSGTDFFVKVHVGGGSFVHIWVYRCPPMVAQKFYQLKGIQDNKTESDQLLPLPWKPPQKLQL